MVRKSKGAISADQEKKLTYMKILEAKEEGDLDWIMGNPDTQNAVATLTSILPGLNELGFTLAVARRKEDGRIMTFLQDIHKGEGHDLELVLALMGKLFEFGVIQGGENLADIKVQ